jgi:hypothetical protein
LIVLLVLAVGVVSACGGATPEPAQPAEESQPTATSQPVEPTDVPTEPPAEAPTEEPTQRPTEAPTEEPTEVPTEPPAEQPVSSEAEALLQERCTVCHALSRTTDARKSQVGWEQTVDRMVKRGAELTDEEQVILIEYLAQTYGQ